MEQGLMWCDPGPAREAVRSACERYYDKFGVRPTECHINPDCDLDGLERAHPITIKRSPRIPPHHYWVGLADERKTDGPVRQGAGSHGEQGL